MVRGFSVSSKLQVIDSQEGSELDFTDDLVDAFRNDKDAMEQYFTAKENSIISQHRIDTNSAREDGVSESELSLWLEQRNALLAELRSQKEDVKDLAGMSDSDRDSESENEPDNTNNPDASATTDGTSGNNTGSYVNGAGASVNGASTSVNGVGTTGNGVGTTGNHSSEDNFRQDSSDVYPTDYSSFDPFED